jgi:hypothetical protein
LWHGFYTADAKAERREARALEPALMALAR